MMNSVIVRIAGRRNFFLFQDCLDWFVGFLRSLSPFPLEPKRKEHKVHKTLFYAWKSVFLKTCSELELTSCAKHVCDLWEKWMITTNLAILNSKKIRSGNHSLNDDEEKYLGSYSPCFNIEFDSEKDRYLAYLDGEMAEGLSLAVEFYKTLRGGDANAFFAFLTRFFLIHDQEELRLQLFSLFEFGEFSWRVLDCFEVDENEK